MRALDLYDDESGATVFRDVIMLALAGFMTLVLLILPHVNPQAKAEESSRIPGNVIVELRWPDDINADVDLWVQAPGDAPVGYSNKGGSVFNLLRDDLGHPGDLTGLNYEFSYSRGVPAGDYTVNTHLYKINAAISAVPVTLVVSVKSAHDQAAKQILAKTLSMERQGEELTIFRFSMDADGALVSGSVHDLPRALRTKVSS